MRSKQTQLFEYFEMKPVKSRYSRTQHGGLRTKKTRKLERPLSTKKWIHLVLKSDKAYGRLSFLTGKNQIFVRKTLRDKAGKFGIKIGDFANVGNHLHLKIRISSRVNFQKFLKSVTSLIARGVTGAKKGNAFGRFWEGLAFTRILLSSLEELNLKGYIEANRREAQVSKSAREKYLKQFNQWVYREERRNHKLESNFVT